MQYESGPALAQPGSSSVSARAEFLLAPLSGSIARTVTRPRSVERSAAASRPTDHTGFEPERGFDHVVHEVVRDVRIEAWRGIHGLRWLAWYFHDHRVTVLTRTTEDHSQ